MSYCLGPIILRLCRNTSNTSIANLPGSFHLLLQILCILHIKPMRTDPLHRLKGHAMHFRIAKSDEHPADEADPSIEAKSSTRRHSLHR